LSGEINTAPGHQLDYLVSTWIHIDLDVLEVS